MTSKLRTHKYFVAIVAALLFFTFTFILWSVSSAPKDEPKVSDTRLSIHLLSAVLDMCKERHGIYPSTLEGLDYLVKNRCVVDLPRDAWGNSFNYRFPSQRRGVTFELWSVGPHAKEQKNGSDEAAIGNWQE